MWRFSDLLPVTDAASVTSLGEGDTPLLPSSGPTLGSFRLHFKAEFRGPTGSFKDRIAAVAAALIRERGLTGAVGTSSGNGGAAMAAYGARGGFPVVLFTTSGIVDGKLRQILAHGATAYIVERLEGGRAGAGVAPTIATMAERAGWLAFLTGARYAPVMMIGAETIAFELAEQHPDLDAVYVPVGGGGLLASIWRGYRRLPDVVTPRLIGVQPEGCPTLRLGLSGALDPLTGPVTTTISGLQVPVLFDYGALEAVTRSSGWSVEVADAQAWNAQRLLAREEGLFVEPAGATALAGYLADLEGGRLTPDDEVAVLLTGAGHKDLAAVDRVAGGNEPLRIGPDEVEDAFARLVRSPETQQSRRIVDTVRSPSQ